MASFSAYETRTQEGGRAVIGRGMSGIPQGRRVGRGGRVTRGRGMGQPVREGGAEGTISRSGGRGRGRLHGQGKMEADVRAEDPKTTISRDDG